MKNFILFTSLLLPLNLSGQLIDTHPVLNQSLLILLESEKINESTESQKKTANEICIASGNNIGPYWWESCDTIPKAICIASGNNIGPYWWESCDTIPKALSRITEN